MSQQQTSQAPPGRRAGTGGHEELNPFQIALQQFDRAADVLELGDSMRHILKHAKRQLVVSIPVKMDGGDVQVFEGYRVQHNIARGPAKGATSSPSAASPKPRACAGYFRSKPSAVSC